MRLQFSQMTGARPYRAGLVGMAVAIMIATSTGCGRQPSTAAGTPNVTPTMPSRAVPAPTNDVERSDSQPADPAGPAKESAARVHEISVDPSSWSAAQSSQSASDEDYFERSKKYVDAQIAKGLSPADLAALPTSETASDGPAPPQTLKEAVAMSATVAIGTVSRVAFSDGGGQSEATITLLVVAKGNGTKDGDQIKVVLGMKL